MFEDRIYILDGAMGTMIQHHGCYGSDFNSELLNLEHPDLIRDIHEAYIDAGADIISTNSFGANALVQASHGMADNVWEMAFAAAKIAREAADASNRKVYVAGSAGPTGRMWNTDFDTFVDAYSVQFDALMKGGVDLILLETCFSSLNAKAAIYALEKTGCSLPLIISATVSDRSGRMLTGQTLESFYYSVEHAPGLVGFGINCALGASEMIPLVNEISRFSKYPTIFYPNAGLPDELGQYRETPQSMASTIGAVADKGLINIVGGCCGTTPEHIAAVVSAVRGKSPRKIIPPDYIRDPLVVSGLECVTIDSSRNFTNVGERTNVAGSRKFARLIASGDYKAAIEVAAEQVSGGADIIDVNMDDPMLDAASCMTRFLKEVSFEPAVAKAALMIDSSQWDTVTAALKCVLGKSIVNSISLKDGEQEFLRKALEIRRLGAAMVVMAFDEKGQATSLDRKIDICRRSYDLLTEAGIPPHDIIFDVNVLTVATGKKEDDGHGADFIEAVRWIKNNLPGALTSGGISNLSFAFRGNNTVREAMHSAFLFHSIKAGLDMAIVNPQMLRVYDSIEPELLQAVEDVILNVDQMAASRLVQYASSVSTSSDTLENKAFEGGKQGDFSSRIMDALVSGSSKGLEEAVMEAYENLSSAVAVVEGPLMAGMARVGELFANGKMFLPQVVKSAEVMREAVSSLEPYMNSSEEISDRPKAVLATVRGDVHDIGKNIVATVLRCSGFDVIDLGVMIPSEEILDKAVECGASLVGVSGLITPSLVRMEELCRLIVSRGLNIPLFVGGAAASALHTAVKLAPIYPDVHYGADASVTAVKAKQCISSRDSFNESESAEHKRMSELYAMGRGIDRGLGYRSPSEGFCRARINDLDVILEPESLIPLFDWRMFTAVCGLSSLDSPVREEALSLLCGLTVRVCARLFEARRDGDDIVTRGGLVLPMLRDTYSLADYFPADDGFSPLGIFALKVCGKVPDGLIAHSAGVTLAEAASSWLSIEIKKQLPDDMKLILPGIGYPCIPDHSLKRDILRQLPSDLDIVLTESAAMIPEASICGLAVAHSEATYHDIRKITREYASNYSARRGFTEEEQRLFIGHLLE